MNFFGHCVLACQVRPRPLFALGAMLPDFATMLGARPPVVEQEEIRAGVAFHHETDRVFHASSAFLRFQAQARSTLARLGVRRGPSLAAAHVGVELILDAHLDDRFNGRDAYHAALSAVAGLSRDSTPWAGTGTSTAFQQLVGFLLQRSAFVVPSGPEEVAQRLWGILQHRPALALDEAEREHTATWACEAWPAISEATPSWHRGLVLALEFK